MKIFFKKLAVLGLIILAVATILQVFVIYKVKDKTINGHDIYTIGKNLDYDVIAFGSSRCAHHFLPDIFQDSLKVKFLNMGVLGHGELSFFYMQLNVYLRHNKAPKVAILNFDPYVTPGPLNFESCVNTAEKHSFSRFAFFAQEDRAEVVRYFDYNWAEKYVPCYAILKYRILFDCIRRPYGKLWEKEHCLKVDNIWDSIREPIPVHDRNGNKYRAFITKRDSVKYELGFIDSFCKSKNIQLICVQGPTYQALYDEKAFSYTGQICKDLKIPFFDKATPELRADIKRYYDPGHMNVKGATDFCRVLCEDTAFTAIIYKAVGRQH